MQIQLRAACLRTRNIEAMIAFYQTMFGHAPVVDGGVDFQFAAEQLTVFRLEAGEGTPTTSAAPIYSAEDVDGIHARLCAQGLCAASDAPTDKPWGVRSFMIADPDGNTVSFAKTL